MLAFQNLGMFSDPCYAVPLFFLIGILGGGVQLGPLGTEATNRPIVSAPGDYDDGEIGGMIGRGNRSTRRKPAPVPLCPPQTPHAVKPGRRVGKPATNRLSYGTASVPLFLYQTFCDTFCRLLILQNGEL
jgi:hypothetical protein